ncbi:hypothetical protein FGLOB1_14388 [Fusarium globosum]|uniref:Uncharacterized protein n=1 Tax=Fusarium globosum TaxID=78864 RepID=A0A8H6CVE7_9HYPO|nr:hypothetical protein FGLOB1_14388 [Fusarium globosum]
MTSHDPVNLYETYIHQTDWNTYMESLEKTGSPIRPIPRVNQKLYDLCNGIMLKVGSADIALRASMKKESGKSHDSEDEDLKSLKEKYPKKVPRPFNNLKVKARALAEKKQEKRKKSIKALSKIGSAMGWGSKRLKSRVFPAEWLHLSAFSWGGISSDDDPEGFSTSQNFENLVFGTSETNSLMTRYETSWQRFFLAESELAGSGAEITGTLGICCNDYNSPILWDVSTGSGQFRTGVLRFTKEDLEAMKKNGFNSNKYLSIKEKKLTDSYIKEQMLVLAHEFPFIVYSIQYDLQADFHSRIFALDNMECSVAFFPFP